MATQGTDSDLLSKVGKFVRHPTTDWSALDSVDPVQDPESAKQALKKMLERKRRNDAVRKLEFDELRKLRRAEPVRRASESGKSSLFLGATDLSELDERATTLKKIDEIESQMSEQWWQSRPSAGAQKTAPVALDDRSEKPVAESDPDAYPTVPAALPTDALPLDEVMTTQAGFADSETSSSDRVLTSAAQRQSNFSPSTNSVFSSSKMVSVDRGQSLSDPVREEAAIRFANGDDAGAEAILLKAMHDEKAKPKQLAAWTDALFDLYRCTGRRDAFDRFALAHGQRTGGVAPVWLSVAGTQPQQPGDDFKDTQVLAPGDAQPVALAGDLRGDCESLLASFQVPQDACLTVSCRDLIRVDFAAAGCLLNWAARVESAGGCIVMRDVSHLVAAFFDLIGINDYAQVNVRTY